MMGILLLIDLGVLVLTSYVVCGQKGLLRESALIGLILWGFGIVFITELLSLFQAIGYWPVLFFWIMVFVVAVVVVFRKRENLPFRMFSCFIKREEDPQGIGSWSFLERVLFNRVVLFTLFLGLIAYLAAPNTYDAMTYHMSRVMHWIQNRSVAYYPTNIPRQLYYPIFPEYVILHFQLLSGGDRWANIVQWVGLCGSLIGSSLIAKELGARIFGQILTTVFVVTIPMGVLQATSTQTDFVATMWLSMFVYFFLCWRKNSLWGYAVLIGCSLGLAVSTKGTAMIFAAPFLLWMCFLIVRRMVVQKFLMVGVVLGVACMFCAGSFYRNSVFFQGDPGKVLSADADNLINGRFCVEGTVANILRNLGLHLSTPWDGTNEVIQKGIYKAASLMHVDLNHKDWSYIGHTFSVIYFRSDEDLTGNFLHLFLYGIIFVFIVGFYKSRKREIGLYLLACFLGWIVFSGILKWQPWHSRFHLPMFVLFSPLAGLVMEKIRARWFVSMVAGVLFISAGIFVFLSVTRPLTGVFNQKMRTAMHFLRVGDAQSVYLGYEMMAGVVQKMGVKNIGLLMGEDTVEYLSWVVLNPSGDRSLRLEHVLVKNASKALKYPRGDFSPEVIVAVNDERPWVLFGENIYPVIWRSGAKGGNVSILLKGPRFDR